MAFRKGLLDLLKADDDLAAAVSTRVRWGRSPEGTSYPHLIVTQVASNFITTLQGVNATQMARIQIDCLGNTMKEADEVKTAVHTLLDGFRGVLSEGSTILSCLPNNDVDLYDEDGKYAGIAADFNIWFVPSNFVAGVTVPQFTEPVIDGGDF